MLRPCRVNCSMRISEYRSDSHLLAVYKVGDLDSYSNFLLLDAYDGECFDW